MRFCVTKYKKRSHPHVHSYLLLFGGADYNVAFKPRCVDWRTTMLHDWALLPSTKARMLKLNEEILRQHNNRDDALHSDARVEPT